MTKPELTGESSEESIFKRFALSWIVVVFVAYCVMGGFQKYAIYPIEAKLLPLYSQYASLVFLPHAVRVLATAIYGPKTFFVLLAAMLLEVYLFYTPVGGSMSLTTLLVATIGAACAPLAYILLKSISSRLFPGLDSSNAIFHWRYIFAAGIIASAINSIGLTMAFFGLSDIGAAALAMGRFFIGDIIGLFVGLVVLTRIFRLLRKVGKGNV